MCSNREMLNRLQPAGGVLSLDHWDRCPLQRPEQVSASSAPRLHAAHTDLRRQEQAALQEQP